jgi:hypothetical protein
VGVAVYVPFRRYQPYAADMAVAQDLLLPKFTGDSKFGIYTNDGGLSNYDDQLTLPSAMNRLAVKATRILLVSAPCDRPLSRGKRTVGCNCC